MTKKEHFFYLFQKENKLIYKTSLFSHAFFFPPRNLLPYPQSIRSFFMCHSQRQHNVIVTKFSFIIFSTDGSSHKETHYASDAKIDSSRVNNVNIHDTRGRRVSFPLPLVFCFVTRRVQMFRSWFKCQLCVKNW